MLKENIDQTKLFNLDLKQEEIATNFVNLNDALVKLTKMREKAKELLIPLLQQAKHNQFDGIIDNDGKGRIVSLVEVSASKVNIAKTLERWDVQYSTKNKRDGSYEITLKFNSPQQVNEIVSQKGYSKIRMYTFLAERFLPYWFKKYTKALEWPVVYCDIKKNYE